MMLSITPVSPAGAAQAAIADVALQPGTVVTAQVLKLLDASLVRIAIQGLALDIATTVPLQAGQTLQLAVTQTKDGLSLAPVLQETATAPRGSAVITDDIPLAPKLSAQTDIIRPSLSPAETRAVTVAAQVAVTKQTGLSPLFANLASAATSGQLPQPVLLAAAQLFALRQPGDKALTGGDIRTALASSGLLLESSLAAKSSSAPVLPDIKAALIVLRQTLATWLRQPAGATSSPATATIAQDSAPPHGNAPSQPAAASATPNRLSSTTISPAVLAAAVAGAETIDPVAIAKSILTAQSSESGPRDGAGEDAPPLSRNLTTPPPFRGALPAAQSVASPTLARDAEPVVVAQQLIAETDGALARQTLLQIASLPDRIDMTMPRNDTMQPRWNFEIPFVTPQGTAMAQFEIARDGSGNEVDASQRVWRARFSLDIEPAGPVHALIAFSGDTTSVKMWAERPATAAQLRANATQLGASLDRADLKAGEIVIADGAPTRAQAPPAGHFLNRAS